MERTLRTLLAGLVAASAALGLTVTSAAPASAAVASCRDYSTYRLFGYQQIPTRGHEDRRQDCRLTDGDSGPGVWLLQLSLQVCYRQDIEGDGRFGPITRLAVRNAQNIIRAQGHSIVNDGTYRWQTGQHMLWYTWELGGPRPCQYDYVPAG